MPRGVLGRMACQVAPASRERKATVFSSPRVTAYTFLLSAGSTAIEYTHPSKSAYPRLRPGGGRSPDRRHVRPASVLLSTPSLVPAYRIQPRRGSTASASTKSAIGGPHFQLRPESVLRYTRPPAVRYRKPGFEGW